MEINPAIFKAYDIRGIYPKEIDGKAAYEIGRAFVEFLNKPRPKIVIGRDNRLSGAVLHKNLLRGLIEAGPKFSGIGLSPTPVLYWFCAHYGYDGGINITASHNPKEYNGFKIVREKAIPVGENSGLKEIKNFARLHRARSKFSGKATKKKAIRDYVRFNLSKDAVSKIKPLVIAVDTANAVPGILIPELTGKIPCKIYHIFKELDGSFPNHSPNPLIKENLTSLREEVKRKKADLGVAFDGDGDRIMFVDEKGKIIPSDMTLALMAEIILKENPRSKILYDVRSSRAVKEVIMESGGMPVMWKVGHSFIKEKMRKENVIFGGEVSGHFYYQKHYFCEAPLFLLLKIAEIISVKGKTLSQLIKSYQRYFHSGEINFEVEDKLEKIRELKKRFNDGEIIEIDGLRVDFKDWWFNVRPSNTEPLLRLVVEAENKKLLEEKKKELAKLIKNP